METFRKVYGVEFREEPLWWHKRGLSQTRSGYGAKLTSSRKAFVDGKWRRVYVTCYGNAGTAWVLVNGERVIVS